MSGYFFLLLTIISESASLIFMKLSENFKHKLFAESGFVCYGLSFLFLTIALTYLPAGLANALWAGAGTVLVGVAGAIVFKEQYNKSQIFSSLL